MSVLVNIFLWLLCLFGYAILVCAGVIFLSMYVAGVDNREYVDDSEEDEDDVC